MNYSSKQTKNRSPVLSALLRDSCLSPKKLSMLAGVSVENVLKISNNNLVSTTLQECRDIADCLGVSLNQLMGYEPIDISNSALKINRSKIKKYPLPYISNSKSNLNNIEDLNRFLRSPDEFRYVAVSPGRSIVVELPDNDSTFNTLYVINCDRSVKTGDLVWGFFDDTQKHGLVEYLECGDDRFFGCNSGRLISVESFAVVGPVSKIIYEEYNK